ncbi:MAG: hypothetical protein M9927_10335, partial [Anaerolineae bacterium]|nr:hypothetical protein [Anaerolineae bacterium]
MTNAGLLRSPEYQIDPCCYHFTTVLKCRHSVIGQSTVWACNILERVLPETSTSAPQSCGPTPEGNHLMTATTGYLLIADISGYTSYLTSS